MFPLFKKKEINPIHAQLSDKVNDLMQNLEVILSKNTIEKLLATVKSRKETITRGDIEKITGI
jgi:hypothetical protein